MNVKTNILKSWATILKAEGYNRAFAYETQKPKNDTYLECEVTDRAQISKTTGGAVYELTLVWRYFTNSDHKLNDEMDKLYNILSKYDHYTPSATLFFNHTVSGVEVGDAESGYKFAITTTLTLEEVA